MTRRRPARGRLLVLQGMFLAGAAVLVLRLVQVQLLRHDHYRAMADAQWVQMRDLPARRGDLFDRFGRPLALSVTTSQIGVAGRLVEDAPGLARVLGEILAADPRGLERTIRRAGDEHAVLHRRAFLDREQRRILARFPAVTCEDLSSRIYPLDGVGASVVGFQSVGPAGDRRTAGLERGLDAELAGRPGRAIHLRSARPGRSLGDVVVEPAAHGVDLVLTLDADLQEICETQLDRAVREFGARGGSVLVLDPDSGDVLAAASSPGLSDRDPQSADPAVWNNRNFTFQYEPGSVFKIFTAAALLESGAVDTTTVIDCRSGDLGSFTIHEAEGHGFGRIDFMEGFARSSNVYFARASANLTPQEQYRLLLDLGFGQRTSAPYPAQPSGLLRPPSQWSGRSQATLAIGQEVAVTPLQLGLAIAAVANGGTLYAPRLVTEIRHQGGSVLERRPPMPLRRVLPETTTSVLRRAMARVVQDGTATGIHRSWISLGGKTGTAQKSRDGHGYTPGCYVATFVALVPADRPRLVVLTVLDEPPGLYHYAAQSAAPLTVAIVEEIRRSTGWLTRLDRAAIRVSSPSTAGTVTVPDVMYIASAAAVATLRAAGLRVDGDRPAGLVVQQVPAAGSRCLPDTPVRLTVQADQPAGDRSACPDLRGLSNRQARDLAARLGLDLKILGAGYVDRQDPAPGMPLAAGAVTVRMVNPWH